ncbi:MAG: flippase [Thermonemataceae bacterium]
MENRRKNLKNILWLFLDKFLRLGGNLIFVVWLARYLQPELFGAWSYALAIVTIFSAFAPLGLDVIVVRELVKKQLPASKILGTAIILRIVFAVVLMLILLLTLHLLNIDLDIVFNLCLIWSFMFIFQSFDVFDYFFQAINDLKQVTFARFFGFIFVFVVKLYALVFQYSILFFGVLHLLEFVATALFFLIFYQKHPKKEKIKTFTFKKSVADTLLKDGLFFMLSNVSMLIHLRIDQIMLKNFVDESVLGYYSAGVKISEALFHIPHVVAIVFFPKVIEARQISQEKYLQNIQTLYSALIWFSIFMLSGILFFADFIVMNSFGQRYAPTVVILQIYIFTNLFANTSYITNRYLALENKTFVTLYKAVLAVGINITLNLWLIPNYGAKGAAFASVISYAFVGFLGDLLFVRNMAFLQIKSIPKIASLLK